MHAGGLWLIMLEFAKMPPKTRLTTRINGATIVEQPTRERVSRMSSPNVNENVGVIREEEVSIKQIFGKVTKILQIVIERWRHRGEDEALERFLKFKPPIFVGEAEQDQKAEAWLESLEDIFRTLQYSEERMIKFTTFHLRGPARNWGT
jgi:hypothetical protein